MTIIGDQGSVQLGTDAASVLESVGGVTVDRDAHVRKVGAQSA